MPHTVRLIALAILLACPAASAAAPQTGSWGDQGNGTFRNPILNADYPDVDIERVGDRFYMITSTMHYAPGMTLLESRDLVNWTLIGHIFDRLDWDPKYNWDRMAGYPFGIFAGDLALHDGTWYCYFIDTTKGLYVSTAKDIRGPWTPAQCMLAKQHWTDPAVYWDDEAKQAWLVCNFGSRHGRKDKTGNEIRMFKMRWDGLALEDEGTPIYYGGGAEAAKIYRIDGTWTIFLAEWIEGDRKQLVLRGPSATGPFQRRIVMERNPASPLGDADRSVCQGALVQAPDGSWWLSHQLVQHRAGGGGPTTERSFEGRSQWLVPVRWDDGWPVVGADATGNGIGNTVPQARMPVEGTLLTAPATDDEFASPALGPQWQWNHNPRDDHWSLTERPGWLRLKAGVPVGKGGFWNAANTLSQRLMGKGKGVATAKLDVSGMAPGQQAGFCRHSGQYVLLGVQVDDAGVRRLFFDHNGKRTLGPALEAGILYVRTDNDGPAATFSYSLDGKDWTRFGEPFTLIFGRWRGDRIGFFCWNDREDAGHLDVDHFRYDYDGPKPAGP